MAGAKRLAGWGWLVVAGLAMAGLVTGCNCGHACPTCPAHASCDPTSPTPSCGCDPGYVADGGSCEDVAAALGGLRWNLPCAGAHVGDGCNAPSKVTTSLTLGGNPGTTYDVTLRFRGVVEYVTVSGGAQDGGVFCVGGMAETTGYNTYSLAVSAPAATYYLNAGHSGPRRCFPVDYTETLPMSGGALVTLVGDPVDTAQILNIDGDGGTNLVPGVPPYPAAYDGQFLQMDILSVVPR